jgi:NAD(P)H-dependent FMN reductase
MPRLMMVIASTRPGRVGLPVAEWFRGRIETHGAFELDVVDLAELALPFMDEPNHPRLHRYEHEHTKAWSARVEAADAFVFVLPEYNYGITAPLKNAIDFLHMEWKYKPVALVSYGGVSAGLRAAAMVRQVMQGVKAVVITDAVSIPMVSQFLDDDQVLHANDTLQESSLIVLDELVKMEAALRPVRDAA